MVLEVGNFAPDFTLSDQYGEELRLSELVTEAPVMLVFFPLAFSGTCTAELRRLRDFSSEFRDAGVRLVGVSADSVFALSEWTKQEGVEFSVLSDYWPHGAVAQRYGAFVEAGGMASRVSMIIGRGQRVLAVFESLLGEQRALSSYSRALEEVTA